MWDLRALIPNISLSAPPSPSFGGHKRKKSADKLIISGPRLFPLWLTEIADERTAARLACFAPMEPFRRSTKKPTETTRAAAAARRRRQGDFYDRA